MQTNTSKEILLSNGQKLNLEECLKKTIEASIKGREVLLGHLGKLKNVQHKHKAGLVSEADQESENVIKGHLAEAYPWISFLGEESSYLKEQNDLQFAKNKYQWIVDPLDGTTNYVHSFPIFCVSIGLELDGEIVLALVDVPILGETYTAIKGHGAFVNGQKMSVSKSTHIKDALLATGFSADYEEALEEQLQIFAKLVRLARGVRRPGAAAYDLCQVARGVFDGFWERNLKPWDSAAGLLLVKEAGGTVATYRGNSYSPFSNSIVAGNRFIVESIIENIKNSLLADTE
jgi:myo-inositol-1(or 4)-monophosphatase